MLLRQDRWRKWVQASSMGPPRCFKVSTWCRVCEFRRPRLHRSVARARGGHREKERERKGKTQIRTTEAAHQSFYQEWTLCAGIKPKSKVGTGLGQAGLDMTTTERQWSSPEEGGSNTLSAWHPLPDLPFILLCLCLEEEEEEERASLPERLSDARSAVSQGSWRRETNIYPSNCRSSPPAAFLTSATLRHRPPELTDPWGRFPSRNHLSTNMLLLFLSFFF